MIAFMLSMKVNEFMEQEPVKYIQINKHEPTKIDTQHENFEDLLICVKNDINVLLVEKREDNGAHNVAKALDLNYASISVGAQTGKHEFLASLMQTETLLKLNFIRYSKRRFILIDELDAGNAGVLTSINSALANGSCAFACGMVEKHENFRIVATANTYGNGATLEFIGRNAIDGATLDRFTVIDWNIDEILN
jgi:hypothetical protein